MRNLMKAFDEVISKVSMSCEVNLNDFFIIIVLKIFILLRYRVWAEFVKVDVG